jgi:hypothetical protein
METLRQYAQSLEERFQLVPIEVFAKILTPNDDAGRHGIVIPAGAQSFFPKLPIPNPAENATNLISGIDAVTRQDKLLGWKYYCRYPEHRITRLNSALNETGYGRRLVVITKARQSTGELIYVTDASVEDKDPSFPQLVRAIFGSEVPTQAGAFIQLPVTALEFSEDAALSELLKLYDGVNSLGWIDTLRVGDTGIGYTFETLVGIEENNDQHADFKGIEVKCKLKKDLRPTGGKINLFQMGPAWADKQRGIERLRRMGQVDPCGYYRCHSQVTTTANNLGLWLQVQPSSGDIDLNKGLECLGIWGQEQLAKRLAEKHSRAVFIKAESRTRAGILQYHYNELIYCERPDIDRFISMVDARRIVFEFMMREKPPGSVRNHGYPWRLVDERQLDQLFGFQAKLR